MKKLCFLFCLVFMLASSITVSARDTEKKVGEVIYHQDFGVLHDFSDCGIKIGTRGENNAVIELDDAHLTITPKNREKFFLILPDTFGVSTYTAEFTFAFTNSYNENGYLAFILNCRGDEPTNVSAIYIRTTGSLDDFSSIPDEMKNLITDGKEITVKIPIVNGILTEIELTSGDTSCTLTTNEVISIGDGSNGFILRNAEVKFSELYIVNGTDYTEKNGYYADNSYSSNPELCDDDSCEQWNTSPDTYDAAFIPVFLALSLIGMYLFGRRKNCRSI